MEDIGKIANDVLKAVNKVDAFPRDALTLLAVGYGTAWTVAKVQTGRLQLPRTPQEFALKALDVINEVCARNDQIPAHYFNRTEAATEILREALEARFAKHLADRAKAEQRAEAVAGDTAGAQP